jgi:hypothetical protein
MASSFMRFQDHTQRRVTVGRTPLVEWSAGRRDLYLTQHSQGTDIRAPAGFEPTTSAGERPQIHALDRAATGIGYQLLILSESVNRILCCNLIVAPSVKKLLTCFGKEGITKYPMEPILNQVDLLYTLLYYFSNILTFIIPPPHLSDFSTRIFHLGYFSVFYVCCVPPFLIWSTSIIFVPLYVAQRS